MRGHPRRVPLIDPEARGRAHPFGEIPDRVAQHVADLVVGVGAGAIAAGGAGEAVQVVIGKGLGAVAGVGQSCHVARGVEGVAQVLQDGAAFDGAQGLEAVGPAVVGVIRGGAVAQGHGAGLAQGVEAAVAGVGGAAFLHGL